MHVRFTLNFLLQGWSCGVTDARESAPVCAREKASLHSVQVHVRGSVRGTLSAEESTALSMSLAPSARFPKIGRDIDFRKPQNAAVRDRG